MANLQANLRSQCAIAADEPQRFLRSVNELFYENTADGDYATFFFSEYDDQTRRLRYANCGNLSALSLRRDDSVERLSSTATVLGLFEKWDCVLEERSFVPEIRSCSTRMVQPKHSTMRRGIRRKALIEALRRYRGRLHKL